MNQVPLGYPLVRQCARGLYFMLLIQSGFLVVFMLLTGFTSASAAESNANYCAVSTEKSGSLGTARALFQDTCTDYKLLDCDPINEGGWQCSSSVIGINAPNGSNITVVAPSTPAETVVSTPEPVAQNSNSGECYVVATGLSQSKIAFDQSCADDQRNDCDPIGSDRWVCSSANVNSTQRYTETHSGTPALAADVQNNSLTVNTIAQQNNATSDNTDTQHKADDSSLTNTQIGRLAPNDLLVLQYDNCPDKDDGHAIPAGKSVVEKYDINNVLVVNGTCGNSILNRFNGASNAVIKASWGTQYLDANGQRVAAVQQSATRWASTLSNGADVWVAEGGQSDFTADVVRQIESRYSNINLKRIHVIQHSTGSGAYNEDFTDSANLSYLKNKTTYQPIANGNVGGNGSANLNQQSFYFVSTARASRFSAEWNAGFQYLPPDCTLRTENCKLDFSDTVELLYIIDDKSTQNVNDFANNYLN
jgi:hypothetical protein